MFYLPESVPLNLSSAQGAFFFSTARLVLLAFKISWLLSLCDKEQLCFYLWWLLLLKWEYKKTTRACWWPGELCQTAKLQGMMPNMRLMNCSAGPLKNNYPFNVKLKLTILRTKSWKNNTSFFFSTVDFGCCLACHMLGGADHSHSQRLFLVYLDRYDYKEHVQGHTICVRLI